MNKPSFIISTFFISALISILITIVGIILIILQAPQDPLNGYSGYGHGLYAFMMYLPISLLFNFVTLFSRKIKEKDINPSVGLLPNKGVLIFLIFLNSIAVFVVNL